MPKGFVAQMHFKFICQLPLDLFCPLFFFCCLKVNGRLMIKNVRSKTNMANISTNQTLSFCVKKGLACLDSPDGCFI